MPAPGEGQAGRRGAGFERHERDRAEPVHARPQHRLAHAGEDSARAGLAHGQGPDRVAGQRNREKEALDARTLREAFTRPSHLPSTIEV